MDHSPPPFSRLVSAHGATVARVCRGLLGSHADAEDAWSETFLSALRAYPRLGPDANHEAWLVTIAHRTALDMIRARGRRPLPMARLPEPPPPQSPPEADHDLWPALAALSLRQRQAIVHHHLAGLTYAEVAALIGGSAEAARRAAADGIARLRTLLRNPPGDRP